MKKAALVATAVALTLTGCSTLGTDPAVTSQVTQGEFLASYGFTGMDGVEIVNHLDQQPVEERPTDLIASVGTDELVLKNTEQDMVFDLPEDLNYLAIAPYVSTTHECFYHSLTTCLGELGNEPIKITITDQTTGNILVSEKTTTFDNGFVGFWIPSDTTGTIEISHQGRSGTTEFLTSDDGATCVTDLQLT